MEITVDKEKAAHIALEVAIDNVSTVTEFYEMRDQIDSSNLTERQKESLRAQLNRSPFGCG